MYYTAILGKLSENTSFKLQGNAVFIKTIQLVHIDRIEYNISSRKFFTNDS